MIDNKNLTDKQIRDILERFIGTMFSLAPFLGIWFDDKEIKYIETKMQTHKLYRLVNGNVAGIYPREDLKLFDFQRAWLTSFLSDSDMPIGVRAFIHYYIGHEQATMKINDKFCRTHKYENSIKHEFLVQRWFETCR